MQRFQSAVELLAQVSGSARNHTHRCGITRVWHRQVLHSLVVLGRALGQAGVCDAWRGNVVHVGACDALRRCGAVAAKRLVALAVAGLALAVAVGVLAHGTFGHTHAKVADVAALLALQGKARGVVVVVVVVVGSIGMG